MLQTFKQDVLLSFSRGSIPPSLNLHCNDDALKAEEASAVANRKIRPSMFTILKLHLRPGRPLEPTLLAVSDHRANHAAIKARRDINDSGKILGRLSNHYHPNNRRNQNFKTKRTFFYLFVLFICNLLQIQMQTSTLYMYGL